MTTPDPSREAFDRHVLTENGIYIRGHGWITRNKQGGYEYEDIQERWLTWQAAMAHASAELEQAHEARRQAQTELAAMQEKCNRIGLDIDLALRGEVNEQSPIAGRLKLIAEAGRWQSIETAPKDGTNFLALIGDQPYEARFDERGRVVRFMHTNFDCKPTHWAPLPVAPNLKGST